MATQIAGPLREQAQSSFREAKLSVRKFRTSNLRVDIDRGIELCFKAMQLMPEGSSQWLVYIEMYAYYLEVRYNHFRDLEDLTTAITCGDKWLSHASHTHDERPMVFLDNGDRYVLLFQHHGNRQDLDRALSCGHSAYAIISPNNMWHQRSLRFLAECYGMLHTRFPDDDSYDRVLQALRKSYEAAIENGADDLWIDVTNLVLAHGRRWDKNRDLEDAKSALPVIKQYVRLLPEAVPSKSLGYRLLEEICIALFDAGSEPNSTLNELLTILLEGLEICTIPTDQAEITEMLTIVYRRKALITQIDIESSREAVRFARQSLKLTPPEHAFFKIREQNLIGALRYLYDLTAEIELLDEAIELGRKELSAETLSTQSRAAASSSLSKDLDRRYDLTYSIDDLDEAIFRARDAVTYESDNTKDYRSYLQTLSAILPRRAKRSMTTEDYDESLAITQRLLSSATTEPEKTTFRFNTSLSLYDRYSITGDVSDWVECLSLARQVYDATPRDSLEDFASRSFWLSSRIYDQYVRNPCEANLEPLNESIMYAKQSLDILPHSHRRWPNYACDLSRRLCQRIPYHQKSSPEYVKSAEETVDTAKAVFESSATPMEKLQVGEVLLVALRMIDDWQQLNTVGKQVLTLLPQINPRSLSRRDMQANLKGFSAISSQIAVNALKAGESPGQAFLMLETGHGLISDAVISKRSDFALLETVDATLSEKYQSLLDCLSTPPPAKFSGGDFVRSRQDALRQVVEIEAQIRQIPGFERFQLPPSTEELQQLAEDGPLVTFTVDFVGSVAFVVTRDKIDLVPLPKLFQGVTETIVDFVIGPSRITKTSIMQRPEMNKGMRLVLKWLWDAAVKPVMDYLGFEGKKDPKLLPRVWWITNGLLGLLPMHAAGSGWDTSFENTASRCVSSYVSTTKALIRARQKSQRLTSSKYVTRCVAVHVPCTPEEGWPDLQTAVEMEHIRQQGEMNNTSVDVYTGPTVQQLLDAVSSGRCPQSLTQQAQMKTILHLACHGDPSDTDPSKTSLLLCNSDKTAVERLTVARLFEENLENAYLAYLSACCTAQQYSKDLIDENMHLGNLFQVLGFSHVIGTMWEADDSSATSLAAMFYRRLFEKLQSYDAQEEPITKTDIGKAVDPSDTTNECRSSQNDAVARSLHEALIELRATKRARGRLIRDDVISWACFVNIGA